MNEKIEREREKRERMIFIHLVWIANKRGVCDACYVKRIDVD